MCVVKRKYLNINIHLKRLNMCITSILAAAAHKHTQPFNGLFPGNLAMRVPEGQTILDLAEARDDGVAVASAEPYASHLHLAPDR